MYSERQVEKRGENVSLGMTNKVSERCCLYQLFPHCVWLSRRWAAQRCPQGLQRRRTGRGAWRDKNLISLQPFLCLPLHPLILPSREDGRMILHIRRHEEQRKSLPFSLQCVWWWRGRAGWELCCQSSLPDFLLSWRSTVSWKPGEGY